MNDRVFLPIFIQVDGGKLHRVGDVDATEEDEAVANLAGALRRVADELEDQGRTDAPHGEERRASDGTLEEGTRAGAGAQQPAADTP